MPWARLDDTFHRHSRVQDALDALAGGDAIALWTLALSWSYDPAGGKSSPFIPARQARRLLPGPHDIDAAVAILVEVGLWEPTDGGYLIHDWNDYRAPELTPEQRRAGGLARAAKADRSPGGTFLPSSSDQVSPGGGQPGGQHQQRPGGTSRHLVAPGPAGAPGDLDQQPGTSRPDHDNNPKVPRGVKGGDGAVAAPYLTAKAWGPFLDAWYARFRLPPTRAQADTLWEAVDAYPAASASFVLDCPAGSKAADVIASVLERFHAIRGDAAQAAARAEAQADADRIARAIPRRTTASTPTRLSAVLDDGLPM